MSKATPQIWTPTLESKMQEEALRQEASFKPQIIAGPDDVGVSAHKPLADADKKHISEKFYLFPESYNALRRELYEHWPALWAGVSWTMAHKAEDFVATMNEALDLKVQFDGNKVGATCSLFLDELRAKRGLSRLN